jgi:hypothetical protein
VLTGIIAGKDARETHLMEKGNSLLAELQDTGPSLSSAFHPVIFSLLECMNNKNSIFLVNSTGFEKRFVLPVGLTLLFRERVFLIIFTDVVSVLVFHISSL